MINNNGNCACVVGDSIVYGITVVRDETGNPKLPVGNLDLLPATALMQWAWLRHSARKGAGRIMCCEGQRQSAKMTHIVYVKVSDFNFGGTPYLEGLNLWPGVEAKGLYPFWSSPYDKTQLLKREQVWFLKGDNELILVDQYGGIRILESKDGVLSLDQPSPSKVAAFFRGRLSSPSISTRAHHWASYNLEHLLRHHPEV